jgi:PKD repeat protein
MKRIITLLAMIAYSFVAKACPFQGTVTHTLTSGASAQLYTAVFPSTNTYTYSWVPAVGATFSSTSISNPTVTFSANGTYYLCCIVTYNGCSTTICDSISINQALGCNASYSYSSSGNTVAFGGIMTGSNSATTYSWIFGDGNTGIGQSTVHTYAPGTYTACLIASNVNPSCTDTFCSTITIAGGATACNAAFTDSNLASTNSVYFINQSTASSSSFFNYWSFGDGNTSTSFNPLHTYANPGTYMVCLYMQDSSSAGICYDSTCQTIVVAGSTSSCNAAMTYTSSGCLGVFVNTSAAGYTNAVWYFGDGTSATNLNQTVSHNYTGTGVYYPFVVVTWMVNGSPCTDTSALGQLYVNCPNASPCNAAFTVSSAGQVVYFTNTSSASNSTFSSYWSFGDGGISGSTNPIHTYANNGIYSVCLYIVDSSSAGICTDSICQTITVGGSSSGTCNAAFIDSVSGLTAMFYNLSTVSGGATYTSSWYFGDGFTSTQTNPIHTYNSPGVYTVCLVIISNNNCIDSFCQIVTVNNPNTVCNASFISTVQMCAVALSNTSTGSYNTGVWVLGNGQYLPLNGNTITANYTSNGTYNVCLVIADSNGMCADTACQAVVIFNCPTSMNNTSLLNQVAISPNPATGFIQLNNTSGQILELTIFNAVGMTVAHQQNIGAKQNIDISNLPSGVYSVMLRSKEGLRYVEKLMKQ